MAKYTGPPDWTPEALAELDEHLANLKTKMVSADRYRISLTPGLSFDGDTHLFTIEIVIENDRRHGNRPF